jgi:hypothetical protein
VGTVNRTKLIIAAAAISALAIPTTSQAAPTSFSAPWPRSHTSGDSGNRMTVDNNTGRAQILRGQVGTPGSALGCAAQGGMIEFEQTVTHSEPISKVTVTYTDALVGPFGFVKAAVRQNGTGVQASVVRGPLTGDGTLEVLLVNNDGSPRTVTGPVDVWFGVEVSGACLPSPPVEIADATFTSLSVE